MKTFLTPGDGAEAAQQADIVRMIRAERRTGSCAEALAVGAGAMLLLFVAGRDSEIRARAADIVNVALERRMCLVRAVASRSRDSWLLDWISLP